MFHMFQSTTTKFSDNCFNKRVLFSVDVFFSVKVYIKYTFENVGYIV